jgi:hypothetical protein
MLILSSPSENIRIGRHRPTLPSSPVYTFALCLFHDLQPQFCRGVKKRYRKFVETALAESQVTPALRAQQVDDHGSPPAAVALTVFTVMKMNEHGTVTSLAVESVRSLAGNSKIQNYRAISQSR